VHGAREPGVGFASAPGAMSTCLSMVCALLLAALLGADEAPFTIELPPPVALARQIADAAGATCHVLRVGVEPSLGAGEGDDVLAALASTGLFEILTAEDAVKPPDAVLTLRRPDDGAVEAELIGRDGRALGAARVAWPRRSASTAPERGDDDERAARYTRERLAIERHADGSSWVPLPWTDWAQPYHYVEHGVEHGALVAIPPGEAWRIVRGGDVLEELAFARLLGDPELAREIEEVRGERRLRWILGFSGVGVAGLAGGLALVLAPDPQASDSATLNAAGVSMLVVAGFCAGFAAIYPWLEASPVQTPADAQRRADGYNARLRRELRASGAQAVPAPP